MHSLKITKKNRNVLLLIAVMAITIALGNMFLQFFLRFLLKDGLRVAWISALTYLALFPLVLWSFNRTQEVLPGTNLDRVMLVILSLLTGCLVYFLFPIKITGNLFLLNQMPLWVYRISRLVNIVSFVLSASFAFFMVLVSLASKTAGKGTWRYLATAFFTVLLVVGLLVYEDYGISSDEPNDRTSGMVTAHFVASKIEEELLEPDPYIPRLSTYRYRYYGVAYQFPLALLENNTLTHGQDVWHLRHLVNFLFFYLGVLAFFHLAADFFKDPRFGLLGALALVLTPRLFAHAFFNPKDTVFLAAFTLALYFSTRFWRRKSYWAAALAGITSAYAVNIRVIALALAALTLGMLLLDLLDKTVKAAWKQTLLYLAVFAASLVLFWPAAWEKPLAYLGEAIRLFSDYAYWDFRVMYLGAYIRGAQAPWHYLPVWMGITIPLPYILLFFLGLAAWVTDILHSRKINLNDHRCRMRVVYLGIFLAPPMLAILLNSTLYNGWRHFQFIYPAFLMIALAGAQALLKGIDPAAFKSTKSILCLSLLVACGLGIISTGVWMIRHHPHQAVYFNQLGLLVGPADFERDYWRISAKEGFQYLLGQDSSENIAICIESQFEQPEFLMILPEEMRARIDIITDPAYFEVCDYTVDTYRSPGTFMCTVPFYEIKVENLPILTITRCGQP